MPEHPQKILANRYLVVPRTIIFIIRDDKVLLQKAAKTKKIFPGFFNGIGGHIERGETPLKGAHRELEEESGLKCADLRLTGTIHIDVTERQGILLFVFLGSKTSGVLRSSSEGELFWIGLDSIQQLKVVEDVPELIQNSLTSLERNSRFHGSYQYDENNQRITTIEWDYQLVR